MPQYEEYVASWAKAAAVAGAAGPAITAFTIKVRFIGGLTNTQRAAFRRAADRWSTVIVGDLPPVTIGGERIDDVLILAEGADIDGVGRVLGQAGPTHLRPPAAGASAFLPARGEMTFDTADLARMEQENTLGDVIAHEMGHVLGIGTIWSRKGLLRGAGTKNPRFTGAGAMAEYGVLRGTAAREVPVENMGGPGTADGHWRETLFRNELMSGFIAAANNPLSRMTVASLQDLGYRVNLDAAEPYGLANLAALAEAGELTPHVAPVDFGVMLPRIPTVLPDDAMTP